MMEYIWQIPWLSIQVVWYALPSFSASATPVIITRFNLCSSLAKPLNNELLGSNKTWRGLIVGLIFPIIIVWIQGWLYRKSVLQSISVINYSTVNLLALGLLFGIGNHCFDLTKSFFKRRLGKKPGERFFPWDNCDAIGGVLFSLLAVAPEWLIIVYTIVLIPLLTRATNFLAYFLGIKSVPS